LFTGLLNGSGIVQALSYSEFDQRLAVGQDDGSVDLLFHGASDQFIAAAPLAALTVVAYDRFNLYRTDGTTSLYHHNRAATGVDLGIAGVVDAVFFDTGRDSAHTPALPKVGLILAQANTVTIYELINGVPSSHTVEAITETVRAVAYAEGMVFIAVDGGVWVYDYLLATQGLDTDLVSTDVNDVAAKVMPGAGVRQTGFSHKKVTWAASTASGTTVHRDGGFNWDITGHTPNFAGFTEDNKVVTSGLLTGEVSVFDLPTADITAAAFDRTYYPDSSGSDPGAPKIQRSAAEAVKAEPMSGGRLGVLSDAGLTIISENLDADVLEPHINSQWQVTLSTDPGFSSPEFDSGDDPVNLESIVVPTTLATATIYLWRVRHEGEISGYSAYSVPTQFTTTAVVSDQRITGDGDFRITADGDFRVVA
jgi:hypothetical protein